MSLRSNSTWFRLLLGVALAALCAPTVADNIEVVYTEIAGSPTAVVPGAKDAAGNPAFAEWTAIEEVALRADGGEWVIKGRSSLASSLDAILILGAGTAGTAFAQDGQPLQGGVAGEQYDFFDSPVPAAWNAVGDLAFSCRAKGGVSSQAEKVIVYSGGVHTVVVKQGDPALGLSDLPPNPSGDETIGNSINSVYLLDSGLVAFANTPIGNCHSSRYPALFHGNTGFRQSGVHAIDGEIWDDFDYDDCGGTADGLHYFAKGETDNPDAGADAILAVDDTVVLREGSPVAGSSVTMAAIFFTRMLSDGTWFCRGDDPADNDWAVRDGVLLVKTGNPITSTENWGNSFSAFNGNRVGDWIMAGNTDNPDTMADLVLVLNGTDIVAREGDAVDVDGNGVFDDNAFINTFQPNDLFLTDTRLAYYLVTLRNGAGTGIGDAFVRQQLPLIALTGDMNCDGVVSFRDINPFVLALSNTDLWHDIYPNCDILNGDINGDGQFSFRDINPFVALLSGL